MSNSPNGQKKQNIKLKKLSKQYFWGGGGGWGSGGCSHPGPRAPGPLGEPGGGGEEPTTSSYGFFINAHSRVMEGIFVKASLPDWYSILENIRAPLVILDIFKQIGVEIRIQRPNGI